VEAEPPLLLRNPAANASPLLADGEPVKTVSERQGTSAPP
jgi:hypothetical protein